MIEAFITEAGRYSELSAEAYHADPVVGGSLSSTGARRILPPDGCPAKFEYERRNPRPHKPYFDFGHAAHRVVLGAGETIEVIDAKDWRTKAAKQQRNEAHDAGKTPILAHDHDRVLAMADALGSHPEASALLAAGHGRPEESIVWRDEQTGVGCRARFDWLPDPIGGRRVAIPDYKTCESASRDACNRAIVQHGYHQQGAWYLAGAQALGLADTSTRFIFIFQEKTAPYLVTTIELDPLGLKLGAALNRWALETFAHCTANDHWPAYVDGITETQLPPWVLNQAERDGLL